MFIYRNRKQKIKKSYAYKKSKRTSALFWISVLRWTAAFVLSLCVSCKKKKTKLDDVYYLYSVEGIVINEFLTGDDPEENALAWELLKYRAEEYGLPTTQESRFPPCPRSA